MLYQQEDKLNKFNMGGNGHLKENCNGKFLLHEKVDLMFS